MPPKVHLPVAVLGMYVSLRAEEVVGGFGVDVRYPVFVSDDFDLTSKRRQRDGAVVLREGTAHRPEHEGGSGDQRQHDDADDDGEPDRQTAAAHRARVGEPAATNVLDGPTCPRLPLAAWRCTRLSR